LSEHNIKRAFRNCGNLRLHFFGQSLGTVYEPANTKNAWTMCFDF